MSRPGDPPGRLVPAGGGLLWRPGADGAPEVGIVHRPRYDDWSLPKGKLDRGEHVLMAAAREVREETGLQVRVGRRSLRTTYPVPEGTKRVDYWVMQAVAGDFTANREVDELRWLPPAEAARLCTHDHDRAVVADVASADETLMPALVLVRHGRAGSRSEWDGPDDLRPLDAQGRAQASRLADVLPEFGPVQLFTAPPLRCRQTVEPLAERLGLDIEPAPEMGEENFAENPGAGVELLERLLRPRPSGGVAVVASQGGAIPSALLQLGVRWQGHGPSAGRLFPPAAKGSTWVVGGRAGALCADYYRNFDPDPDAP